MHDAGGSCRPSRLGSLAIVEPDNQWWRELISAAPRRSLKVVRPEFGCFTIVNRGRSMQSRAMERALADQGELQRHAACGKAGQVKAADYFEPNIVTANQNSGGSGIRRRGRGARRPVRRRRKLRRRLAGGINVKKGEANVTLSVVNARTTEELGRKAMPARRTSAGAPAAAAAGGDGFAAPAEPWLPEYRDRPGDRARLSRRLHQAGRRSSADSRPTRGRGAAGAAEASACGRRGRVRQPRRSSTGRPFGRTRLHRAKRPRVAPDLCGSISCVSSSRRLSASARQRFAARRLRDRARRVESRRDRRGRSRRARVRPSRLRSRAGQRSRRSRTRSSSSPTA